MLKYSILNNQIEIEDTEDFVPEHTLDCGQVFRYSKTESGYKIFSKNSFCSLIYEKGHVIINTTDADYFVRYFDLDRDYGAIKNSLFGYPNMGEAINHGHGIRILNQDPFETLISFIVSQNNNIPRIKKIIGKLQDELGEDIVGGKAFPTVDALLTADVGFYREIGAGYRAEYLVDTVRRVSEGFDLNLYSKTTAEARKALMSLRGVGRKVADCVLLFAYHKTDAFPTDVWIEKVYDNLFGKDNLSREKKADVLSDYYGDLSGYAQQFLFYNIRG